MKRILVIFAILLNVISTFGQVTEEIEQTKARLRTNCLEEGEPASDLLELNSLLNSRPDGYAFKFQFTAIAIKDTYIRFQREAGDFNREQGFDIVIKMGYVFLYCDTCDKKLPFDPYYQRKDPVGFDWELPHDIVIALTDGGLLTVSVDGDQFYDYNHTLPHPINYVQFIQTHPYTSHTVFFYNCTSNEEPQCGKRVIENNTPLTSGVETREGDWPWHSAIWHTISEQRSYACGGTLINSNAVLTAAHCLYIKGLSLGPDRLIVQIGNQNLPLASLNTQEFRVNRLIVHSDYDRTTLLNDIAIIRLATEVKFTSYIRPICLWEDNRLVLRKGIDRSGVVVGWGYNERDELSEKLYQAIMPIIDPIDCLESYPDYFTSFVRRSRFCAGFKNGTGTCNRDTGGGMYVLEQGSFYLRGIVSQTKTRNTRNICDPEKYISFTSTAHYLQWIRENSK